MLTYSVYSESGGVAKTTTAANLAVAHARADFEVLMIDMDPQNASLSYLLDVDKIRADGEVDNLVRHLIDRPKGDFWDLVRTAEHGIDVLPTHNMYERLTELLLKTADIEEQTNPDPDYEFPKHAQLLRVLRENGVQDEYDVIILDPPANGEPHQNNALYATRNVVIPVELSGKGEQSIQGLEEIVTAMEETLDIEIGVLALVPFKYEGTTDQDNYLDLLDELPYEVPVVFRKRTSLMEGCWRQQCTAFTYVKDHRERRRDYEVDTLEKFETLARHLEREAGLTQPASEVTTT